MAQVRRSMMDMGIRKEKACTWIVIDRRVYAFESGDRSHPLHRYIYNYLEVLIKKMKANGYVLNTSLVVQNVDEQTKEEMLLGHSEKLSIGLCLICMSPGTRITIIKNI
ncbi:hypothetical protein GIB67_043093 [Kingdonia uniflora]|uniref:DYW domain-containing protein n=1 Tax=Kingdonia uniflora TaxID=39325 RepID=A0A7J7NFG6_9MAGN|nr:hypothetical protein GIB67_043093 [Kingdonia uniflora]